MIEKIAHTLGSRMVVALLNIVLLFITTRVLGAEIKGLISLFILNLSVTSILSGFVGGPAIVYLTPRQSVPKLLAANAIWIFISVSIVTSFFLYLEFLNSVDHFRFFRMAIMECLIVSLSMVLLGKEKIKTNNLLQVIKVAVTVFILGYLIYTHHESFQAFLDAYEISLAVTTILSLIFTLNYLKPEKKSTWLETWKGGFRLGSIVQIGNLAQLLNYRIGYYVLEIVISPIEVALIRIGIFSASLQIAEALWQFTRSVNTVQYSSIANIVDRSKALSLSIRLVRLNYAVTLIGILFLVILPSDFYAFAFGDEFSEIKTHFLIISPGILALAFGGGINHYFAGLGEHRYNTISTIFGLTVSLAIVFPLCQALGTHGAALAASIVYCVQAVTQVYFLCRRDRIKLSAFYLTFKDWEEARNLLSQFWNRS